MKRALLIGLMTASTAASAQGVTLQQLLDAADQNSVDRRISAEQSNRVQAEYRQAWSGLLPFLSANGAYLANQYNSEITIPGDEPGTFRTATILPYHQLEGTIRIDVPLIDASRWLRTAASSAAQGGAAERELLTRDQVKRQVVFSWYNYSSALALRESARKSLAAAEEQAKLQAIRLSAGAATEIERLRANAERARNQQLVADMENLVAVSRRTLRTLTFVDPGEVAPLPEDDLRPEAPLEEYEARIEELPAVRAADKDVTVNRRLLTAQRLAILPTIGAQYTERLTNATGFTGRTAANNSGVYLNWRLDVPTFMAMGAQRSALSLAELSAERTRLAATDQIHNDWQRQRAAVTKVEAARAQVEAAQRAAQVARDRYSVGASTQLDVILAERDVFSAEAGQIQARTDLASARAGLRISAGLPLNAP